MFFFSSRRRHTRWTGAWSSHVCSSDLPLASTAKVRRGLQNVLTQKRFRRNLISFEFNRPITSQFQIGKQTQRLHYFTARSEERRVGKECRSRWLPYD